MIKGVKLGPGDKEEISANTPLYMGQSNCGTWNQLPVEALATFPCKSHNFRKSVRKVIISEEKWKVFEGW
jgi:hypothetical protein